MVTLIRVSVCLLIMAGASATASGPLGPQERAYKIGRCVVEKDRDAAIRLMDRLPLEEGEVRVAASDLGAGSSCADGFEDGLSTTALRGGIAQELFLRDFQEFGVEPRRKSGFADLKLPVQAQGRPGASSVTNLYALGDCVVRNRTDDIDMLFKLPPGSSREEAIFARLAPVMSVCNVGGGQAKVSRSSLRSILAQSAYSVSARYWNGRLKGLLS